MKQKLIAVFFIILLFIAGCGTNQSTKTAPSSSITSPESDVTQSPPPTASGQATKIEPPTGHLWKSEYKGLLIQINSAEMTKDVFDHEFLVFNLTVQNGTEQPIDVSGSDFTLLTVNKEMLQYDPTAETVDTADNQTATVLSGGQRTLRVGFVVQPEAVSELIFNVGPNAVYRITAFDVEQSSPTNPSTSTTPVEGTTDTNNTTAIEGGDAKSDEFIFEDNYLGYLNTLIEAINTGDFSLVEIHLLYDSDLYAQQQKLVQTLSAKGTREELVHYEIQSTSYDEDSSTLTMNVREQIKVIWADGTEKTSDNMWTYTALQVDHGVFQFNSIAQAATSEK